MLERVQVDEDPPPYKVDYLPVHPALCRTSTLTPLSDSRSHPTIPSLAQWTGHTHADATGLQLKTLQRMLERLKSGGVPKVEMNWIQQLTSSTGGNEVITSAQWKAALPFMYVWVDFASIPQPSAGALTQNLIPQEVSRRGSFFGSFRQSSFKVESGVAGALGETRGATGDAADAGETKGEATAEETSDHRHQNTDEPLWLKHVKVWLGKGGVSRKL